MRSGESSKRYLVLCEGSYNVPGTLLELDAKETDSDIYLIFQPGEETGSGALFCRELIREEGITRVFAFHNLGGYPEGSVVYRRGLTQPASEGLRICFEGKASHASAPEEGMNPSGVIARVILRAEELAGDQSDEMLLCTITGVSLGTGDFGECCRFVCGACSFGEV